MSAEVILVTRNIVVRGGDYNDMVRLGYGGRILVSSMVDDEMNALTGMCVRILSNIMAFAGILLHTHLKISCQFGIRFPCF